MAWQPVPVFMDGQVLTITAMNIIRQQELASMPGRSTVVGQIAYASAVNEVSLIDLGPQGSVFLSGSGSPPRWVPVVIGDQRTGEGTNGAAVPTWGSLRLTYEPNWQHR